MTNNTSLVLAIERIADGKVLLFPADAQEGNWLSWHDVAIEWNVIGGAGAGHGDCAATSWRARSSTKSATTRATTPP